MWYLYLCLNLCQPPVGVVEPRTILSHLDNALDIAEMHKGQGAILEKVSVVTKPKAKLGDKTKNIKWNIQLFWNVAFILCFEIKSSFVSFKVITTVDFPQDHLTIWVIHHLPEALIIAEEFFQTSERRVALPTSWTKPFQTGKRKGEKSILNKSLVVCWRLYIDIELVASLEI